MLVRILIYRFGLDHRRGELARAQRQVVSNKLFPFNRRRGDVLRGCAPGQAYECGVSKDDHEKTIMSSK